MTRSLDRLRQAVADSQEDYTHKLDAQWLSTVPDQYRGHLVKEVEDGWGGSLTESGVDMLTDYIENPSRFLILRGTAGTGKSTLAATLGRKILHDKQLSAAFVNSITMLSEFSFKGDSNPVGHYASFGLLVIDDLGAVNEGLTAHQQKSFWNLIESRWSTRDRYTIITTNMAIQDNNEGIGLSSWIGDSGWDRIASDLTRINMSGESFRL